MKKRIAIDARLVGAKSTGDTTYWTCLLQALATFDHGFELLLYSNKPRPENIPEAPGHTWIHLPASQSRWWSYVAFPMAARRAGCDALHTQYSLSPLARNGLTLVHDVSFFVGPQWFKTRDRAMLRASIPASVRRAKRVFTVSNTSASEIQRFIPSAKGKTVVTYNATPTWIQPVDPAEAKSRVAGLGLTDPYILSVSTRWPRKNMELAIQATRDAGLPLVLTGKSGWGDQSAPSHVKVLGYVGDEMLGPLYSAASLYVCPSFHEGFGLPLVEAFSCGCPVICSSGGALPEVAGDAAYVERSWDAADWSTSIRNLLNDSSKLDQMRQSGYARAKAFSWVKTAKIVAETYKEVANG